MQDIGYKSGALNASDKYPAFQPMGGVGLDTHLSSVQARSDILIRFRVYTGSPQDGFTRPAKVSLAVLPTGLDVSEIDA
jgi:hypothetical protein